MSDLSLSESDVFCPVLMSRISLEISGMFGFSWYSVSGSVSTVSGGVAYELLSELSLFPDELLPILCSYAPLLYRAIGEPLFFLWFGRSCLCLS